MKLIKLILKRKVWCVYKTSAFYFMNEYDEAFEESPQYQTFFKTRSMNKAVGVTNYMNANDNSTLSDALKNWKKWIY